VPQLLAFLKPDAVLRKDVGATIVKELVENEDLEILSFEERSVDEGLSAEHYAHVADRPFYPWLERYVTGCPVYVMLIEVEDEESVERLREFLGKTISHEAEPGTIRGRFGVYAGVNCVHLSDSLESGEIETTRWKERLGIAEGRFDMSIEEFIARFDETLPDHTGLLRCLCMLIAHDGSVSEEQMAKVRTLLKEECTDATDEQLELLAQTIVGSAIN
jgi:nucleoside-diphosphate kinase